MLGRRLRGFWELKSLDAEAIRAILQSPMLLTPTRSGS
jgi:hypothetical protein